MADSEGFGERGVITSFYLVNDQLRFEINSEALRRSGLHVSARLSKPGHLLGAEST